jgi:membrane protease YdiL (CAAX protease family)
LNGGACPSCGVPARENATFCGRCGASLGGVAPPLSEHDELLRAAIREASAAPGEGASGDASAGLRAALTIYFAALAVLITGIVLEIEDLRALRKLDLAFLVIGLVGLTATWRENLALLRPPTLGLRGAALALAGAAGALAVAQLLGLFLPMLEDDLFATYRAQGLTLSDALFDIAVMPALSEELIFRGVLLSGLKRPFRERTAVWVSALLFASIHLSPVSFVHLSLLGLVLAMVRLRSGSLYPCVLIHGGYNALIVLMGW